MQIQLFDSRVCVVLAWKDTVRLEIFLSWIGTYCGGLAGKTLCDCVCKPLIALIIFVSQLTWISLAVLKTMRRPRMFETSSMYGGYGLRLIMIQNKWMLS